MWPCGCQRAYVDVGEPLAICGRSHGSLDPGTYADGIIIITSDGGSTWDKTTFAGQDINAFSIEGDAIPAAAFAAAAAAARKLLVD